jgi:hypothetical protein
VSRGAGGHSRRGPGRGGSRRRWGGRGHGGGSGGSEEGRLKIQKVWIHIQEAWISTKIGAQTDRRTNRLVCHFLRVSRACALQTRQKGSYPVVSWQSSCLVFSHIFNALENKISFPEFFGNL